MPTSEVSSLFDAHYYQTGLGHPYERNAHWLTFFGNVAETIVRSLRPKTVFDAGCAMGLLVESLWDRGVETYGIDISEFAISQVRRDIKPYCTRGSITEPIEGRFDVVTCIEVLEHLFPEQTEAAIQTITRLSDTILFSSTPTNLSEPTHFNVRPTINWLRLFQKYEFWPDPRFDASFLAPHAVLLRKQVPPPEDGLLSIAETIRWRTAFAENAAHSRQATDTALAELKSSLEAISISERKCAAAVEEQGRLESRLAEVTHAMASVTRERDHLQSCLGELRILHNQILEREQQHAQLQLEMRTAEKERTSLVQQFEDFRRNKEAEIAELNRKLQNIGSANESAAEYAAIDRALKEQARSPTARSLWDALRRTAAGRNLRRITRRKPTIGNIGEDVELLSGSLLFDSVWYLTKNPDVAAAGINPVLHYLERGAFEGRDPSPQFSGRAYLEAYPDVARARFNPLIHFLRFGQREGRTYAPAVAKSDSPREEFKVSSPAEPQSGRHQCSPQTIRQLEILSSSPLFDAEWYRQTYAHIPEAVADPALHYLEHGSTALFNPGPKFDAAWYVKCYPDVLNAKLNPLLHYLQYGVPENRSIRAVADPCAAQTLITNQFLDSMPVAVYSVPSESVRINLVTNSIGAGALYGGVATALIFSTLLAKKIGASLRIITRREEPTASNYGRILAANGVSWEGDVEFLFASVEEMRRIPVSDSDVFITTSWWTTKAVRGAVRASRILYLLQEDERMFYPYGDERLRCEEAIQDAEIHYAINSELLFTHLTSGEDACVNIRRNGFWFEPAFPKSNYYPEQSASPSGKKQFFFYARPNNLRNLYWRGLQVISTAIETGVLSPADWDFHFVGRDLGRVVLPSSIVPNLYQNLQWSEYAALVRKMDLALCLMDTPHPSYPPLDLAASGAVVVTSKRGVKTALDSYSKNIIVAEPQVDTLVAAIEGAVNLVHNDALRASYYAAAALNRDWTTALESVLDHSAKVLSEEAR